jgi:hypothetical protein
MDKRCPKRLKAMINERNKFNQYEFDSNKQQKKFRAEGLMNKVLSGQHQSENQASKSMSYQMNNPTKLSLQEIQAIELSGGTIGRDGYGSLNK